MKRFSNMIKDIPGKGSFTICGGSPDVSERPWRSAKWGAVLIF
ncbi:MAG TPA: hypothetical protein VG347_17500 [Verrucomicrobiae bacterium]|nr:hypothetical protein [Verrucomicrobiae bacterium]